MLAHRFLAGETESVCLLGVQQDRMELFLAGSECEREGNTLVSKWLTLANRILVFTVRISVFCCRRLSMLSTVFVCGIVS